MSKRILDKIAKAIWISEDSDNDLSKYKVPCNLFKDMSSKWLYHDYAIELEVSHESAEKAISLLDKKNKDKLYMKKESWRICEVSRVHTLPQTKIQKIYNYLKEDYKDKLPIGNDWNISWWVHFHVFLNKDSNYKDFLNERYYISSQYNPNRENQKANSIEFNKTLLKNFKCLPLNFKYYNDNLIWRFNIKSNIQKKLNCSTNDSIVWKHLSWWLRNWNSPDWTSLIHSIEFRFNQVVDIRLYWYYIWLYLLSLNWITLNESINDFSNLLSFEKTYRNHDNNMYPERTQKNQFNSEASSLLNEDFNFHCDDIISKLWHSYKLDQSEKKAIVSNLEIVHKALLANNLPNASKQLREYQKEYNII